MVDRSSRPHAHRTRPRSRWNGGSCRRISRAGPGWPTAAPGPARAAADLRRRARDDRGGRRAVGLRGPGGAAVPPARAGAPAGSAGV